MNKRYVRFHSLKTYGKKPFDDEYDKNSGENLEKDAP